jgi:hypothetical protein
LTSIAREFRQRSQPRRGLRRTEAAAFIGVSPTKFDEWVEKGIMPKPKRQDGVVVWDMVALDVAFEALPDEDGITHAANDGGWD